MRASPSLGPITDYPINSRNSYYPVNQVGSNQPRLAIPLLPFLSLGLHFLVPSLQDRVNPTCEVLCWPRLLLPGRVESCFFVVLLFMWRFLQFIDKPQ